MKDKSREALDAFDSSARKLSQKLDKLPTFDMEPNGRIERRTERLRETCDSATFAHAIATTAEVYIACMHVAEEVVTILEQEETEALRLAGAPGKARSSAERKAEVQHVADRILEMLKSAQGNQAQGMPMTPEMLDKMLRSKIIQ